MFPTCRARRHGKSGDETARFLAALQGTSLCHLHTVSPCPRARGPASRAPLRREDDCRHQRPRSVGSPAPPSFPRHKPADRPSVSATSLGGWGTSAPQSAGRRTVKSLPARGVRRLAPAGNGLLMSFFQDDNETPLVLSICPLVLSLLSSAGPCSAASMHGDARQGRATLWGQAGFSERPPRGARILSSVPLLLSHLPCLPALSLVMNGEDVCVCVSVRAHACVCACDHGNAEPSWSHPQAWHLDFVHT